MSNPLMKYVKQYRILSEIDQATNNFPKDWKPKNTGNIDESNCDNDIYIKCGKGGKIFYIGRNKLMFYCSSKIRCNNLVKAINNDEIVKDYQQSDVEGWFYFHPKYLESLEDVLEISKYGAGRSPFSTKNLPYSNYEIPEEDLNEFKLATDGMELLQMAQLTKKVNGKFTDKHKKDMRLQGLKPKEYIHKIGKWNKYIEEIKKERVNV